MQMQDVENNHFIRCFQLCMTLLILLVLGACRDKQIEEIKPVFIGLNKSGFNEQVVFSKSLSYIALNPNKKNEIKYLIVGKANFDSLNSDFFFWGLSQKFQYQADMYHDLGEALWTDFYPLWDGNKYIFSTDGGVSDGQHELWRNESISSPDGIKLFRDTNNSLVSMSLEKFDIETQTDKLVIRDAYDGRELRSIILPNLVRTVGDTTYTVNRELYLNLDKDQHINEIVINTSVVNHEEFADVYDANLKSLRRIELPMSRKAASIDWPSSQNRSYVINGDLIGNSIIVKNKQNQVVLGTRIQNTCATGNHIETSNTYFQKDKNYLVVLAGGISECHQSVLSIFDEKANLVYQKEFPRTWSFVSTNIDKDRQALLIANEKGLIMISMP